jgi:hypothetical protein
MGSSRTRKQVRKAWWRSWKPILLLRAAASTRYASHAKSDDVSRLTMSQLGFRDDLGDGPFDVREGMEADIETLHDGAHWLSKWKNSTIDGVLFVTGESMKSVQDGLARINNILGDTITELRNEKGEDRGLASRDAAGKEQYVWCSRSYLTVTDDSKLWLCRWHLSALC